MSDAGNNTSALLAQLLTLPGEGRLARVRESLGEFASESTKVTDALVSLGDEAERLAVVEVSRALSASELSVSLADEANAPRARARARRARGQALAYAGRFDEALGLCAEAERIATAHGEAIEAARAKLASMHALSELGRYDEAIVAGETARQAFLAAGRPELAARADINLGGTYQNKDEPALALRYLDRAREALDQEPVLFGHVESNRGEALVLLSRFEEAKSAFLSALNTYENTGLRNVAAIAEGNLADLAARQGLLQEAIYHFERSRRNFEADAAAGHLVRLLSEQAEAIGALGLTNDAVGAYEAVIPKLREHGMAWEEARALHGLGRCLFHLGQIERATNAVRAAQGLFSTLGHPGGRARSLLLEAELLRVQGNLDQSQRCLHECRELLRDRPADTAAIELQYAALLLAMGRETEALTHVDAGLVLAEDLDIAPLRAELRNQRGLVFLELGRLDNAVAEFRMAVIQTERIRGTLQAERLRAAFLGNRLAPYESLVRALIERGGSDALAEAFVTVERIKSRALLDLLRGALEAAETKAGEGTQRSAELPEPGEAVLLAELARLRRELNVLYSRLATDGRTGERKLALRPWQQALHEREAAVERLQTRLSSTRSLRRLGVSELFANPVRLSEAARLTETNGALIEYFVAGDELMAFVITPRSQVVVRELGSASELSEQVARVQFQLRRSLRNRAAGGNGDGRLLSDIRRELHSLWRMVFAPVARYVADTSRLLIVPHGPLHLVPFHALWDGQRFLIEQFEFVYGPSASVLAHAAETVDEPGADRRPLVIGVADQLAPRIEAEAKLVAGILNARPALLNGAATTDAFLAAAGNAQVIHLACHGRFSSSTPLASGLRLSDRWLTAREIYGLRLNAELVTLSGCETGRHLVASGDEILGLVRGFLAAGAASLLVSLWSANDESTSEMMARFYQMWTGKRSGSLGKAGALRHAQLESLAHRPHPASWATFVLVGRS